MVEARVGELSQRGLGAIRDSKPGLGDHLPVIGAVADSQDVGAVKPELVLDPQVQSDGSQTVDYGFVLDPKRS